MREQRLALPIYRDAWKELEKALDSWGTPDYYVVDAAGDLRFGPLRDLLAVSAQMALSAE